MSRRDPFINGAILGLTTGFLFGPIRGLVASAAFFFAVAGLTECLRRNFSAHDAEAINRASRGLTRLGSGIFAGQVTVILRNAAKHFVEGQVNYTH